MTEPFEESFEERVERELAQREARDEASSVSETNLSGELESVVCERRDWIAFKASGDLCVFDNASGQYLNLQDELQDVGPLMHGGWMNDGKYLVVAPGRYWHPERMRIVSDPSGQTYVDIDNDVSMSFQKGLEPPDSAQVKVYREGNLLREFNGVRQPIVSPSGRYLRIDKWNDNKHAQVYDWKFDRVSRVPNGLSFKGPFWLPGDRALLSTTKKVYYLANPDMSRVQEISGEGMWLARTSANLKYGIYSVGFQPPRIAVVEIQGWKKVLEVGGNPSFSPDSDAVVFNPGGSTYLGEKTFKLPDGSDFTYPAYGEEDYLQIAYFDGRTQKLPVMGRFPIWRPKP